MRLSQHLNIKQGIKQGIIQDHVLTAVYSPYIEYIRRVAEGMSSNTDFMWRHMEGVCSGHGDTQKVCVVDMEIYRRCV